MLAINEEIADLKAEINVLQAKIAAREAEFPNDMAYIIELRRELVASKNELVASKNVLVELRKEKNILLQRKWCINFGSSGASMTSSKHSAGYSWLVFQQVLELLYAVPYITIGLGEAKNNDIELVSTKFKET